MYSFMKFSEIMGMKPPSTNKVQVDEIIAAEFPEFKSINFKAKNIIKEKIV